MIGERVPLELAVPLCRLSSGGNNQIAVHPLKRSEMMNRLRLSVLLAMGLVSGTIWGDDQEPLLPSNVDSTDVAMTTIRGGIKTKAGRPIVRVNVSLESTDHKMGESFAVSALTDEKGEFRFDNIELGSYRVSAKKRGWESEEQLVTVQEDAADQEMAVAFVMELTYLNRLMANVRFGSLTYVVIFGLLVFVANFFIAPRPVLGVTVFGWFVVFLWLIRINLQHNTGRRCRA